MFTYFPLVWSAAIVPIGMLAAAPRAVSIIIRVTYNTLEAICEDRFTLTESTVQGPAY